MEKNLFNINYNDSIITKKKEQVLLSTEDIDLKTCSFFFIIVKKGYWQVSDVRNTCSKLIPAH